MDKDLLKQAISCLHIKDVFLRESHIKLAEDFNPKLPGLSSLTVQYRSGCSKSGVLDIAIGENKNIQILVAMYECAYRLVPPEIPKEVLNKEEEVRELILAEVKATFITEYEISCEDLSKEAIDMFCINNVGYHVWPYWREYAQSTASRLRLPAITIPLYTLPDD